MHRFLGRWMKRRAPASCLNRRPRSQLAREQSVYPPRTALLIAILLLAFALRLANWGRDRFLEDEALYAYWALQIATGTDPLLDNEPVDKPPLYPYLVAMGYRVLGLPSEAQSEAIVLESAARVPSLLASTAAVSLTYALSRRLYSSGHVAVLASLLVAASPFDILFASTAFTDPVMSTLGLAAVVAAASRRPGTSGIMAGLATASKQQGFFFLPLALLIAHVSHRRLNRDLPAGVRSGCHRGLASVVRWPWLRSTLAFVCVFTVVVWWDSARTQRPGFMGQSLISYGGLMLADPSELPARGLDWLKLLARLWPSPWLGVLLVVAVAVVACRELAQQGFPRVHRSDLVLLAFTSCFLLLHWLVAFRVWDRYLLLLVPVFAVLIARGLLQPTERRVLGLSENLYASTVLVLVLASLIMPLAAALEGDLAIWGDHGAYDGVDDLARYVQDHLPANAVLYHYWLGHHYRFYLYDRPLRLHWYPDLVDLVQDAYVYRHEPRFIAFPSWKDRFPVELALANAGFHLELQYLATRRDGTVSFSLFRLHGP